MTAQAQIAGAGTWMKASCHLVSSEVKVTNPGDPGVRALSESWWWWSLSVDDHCLWRWRCLLCGHQSALSPVITSVVTRWQMGPGHSPLTAVCCPRPGSSQHLTSQATTETRSSQSLKSSTRSHRDDCDALLSRYSIHYWSWWNSVDKRVSGM